MTNNKIQELLEQLHEEIHKDGALDEKGRELLKHLTSDINSLLAGESDKSSETLVQRLQDSIDQFEVEHPDLTMALSEMMKILSNAGISTKSGRDFSSAFWSIYFLLWKSA